VQDDKFTAGAVGVIWAIMWFFLVYDSPAQHPRISAEEREYIEKALNKKTETKVVNVSHIRLRRIIIVIPPTSIIKMRRGVSLFVRWSV